VKKSRLPVMPQRASRGWRGSSLAKPELESTPRTPELGEPWLLDSREVARLLGIGRTKTFQLMASGELPTIRLGTCVRVPASALYSWIGSRTALPGDAA
jgi:excisionase family DNA binding protein